MCANFPPLPNNYKESRRNELVIMELEKKRCVFADNEKGNVFLDRMIFSSLAISYAWNYGTIREFINDIVQSILYENQLFLCDCTIYLEAEYETIIKRNLSRTNFLDERWISKKVIDRMKYFYQVCFETFESENFYVIHTDNRKVEEIAQEILKIDMQRKRVTKEQRAQEFLLLLEKLEL